MLHLILIMFFMCYTSYPQWSTNPYENLQVAVHGGNIHVVMGTAELLLPLIILMMWSKGICRLLIDTGILNGTNQK
jgi:hypothetical protein